MARPKTTFLGLAGEIRNSIYENFLSDPKGVFIDLHPNGLWASGSRDRLALTATCRQIRKEVTSLLDKATTFHLKLEFTTTREGNQIPRRPFDLDAWLDCTIPYAFSNVKRVVLQCGRLKARGLSPDACMYDLETMVYCLPFTCERFLSAHIKVFAHVNVECAAGEDIPLKLPLHDLSRATRHAEEMLALRRASLKFLRKDGLSEDKLREYRTGVWQRLYRSEQQVRELLKLVSRGIDHVTTALRSGKSIADVRKLRMEGYMDRKELCGG